MKKVLKWFFGTVIILLACVLVFAGFLYARGNSKVNKVYPATFDPVQVAPDSAGVVHGQYLSVPGRRQLNPEFMPWEDTAHMTDQDLEAIFRYIESEVE